MRIERLDLARYGAFTDRRIELRPGAPLHIVLGPNEAGKTSALNAIGDLLFGFGHITKFDFLHEQKSLRVGARLALADGSTLSIRRRKGAKNTLLDADDKPLADDPLALLLGSVTRDAFFSEFGLTAEALRDGGRDLLKADGRLAETLAASSAQLSILTRIRTRLEAEAEALFGARRAESKEFYAVLKRHEEAQRRLREAIVPAEALRDAEQAVAEAKDRHAALTREHDRLGRDLALRQRALRTRPKLARLQALRDELAQCAGLPAVEASTLKNWESALAQESRAEAELLKQEAETAAGAEAIAALNLDQALLDDAKQIEALREQLGGVRAAEKDLPSRRTRLRVAGDALDALARRLGLEDGQRLLTREPTDAALARAEALIDRRAEAERRLAEAKETLRAADAESARREADAQKLGSRVDPEPMRRRFDLFADVPADAVQLRRERLAQDRARARLDEDAQRLDPFAGAPDALARLALPDASQIEAARQNFDALEAAGKQAEAEIKALESDLDAFEAKAASLSQAGVVATRQELAAARVAREAAYRALGAALDGDAAARNDTFYALGFANRDIDATTDLLLTGAERAALLEAARERVTALTRKKKELEALGDARFARWRAEEESWRALWTRSGLAPMSPQRMTVWRKDVEGILQRRRELDDAQLELATLARKLDEQRDGLVRLGADLGETLDAAAPLDISHKQLRGAVDRLQAQWSEAHTTLALLDKAKETQRAAARDRGEIEAELTQLAAAWPAALAAIGVDGAATPAEAKAALAVWSKVPEHRATFAEEEHRIEAMCANIAAFETEVAALVRAAAPNLAELPPRDALDAISAALKQSQAAQAKRATLLEAQQRREATRAKLAQTRDAATRMLDAARAALALEAAAPLEPVLARLNERLDLERKCVEAERDLAETADGHDEETLRGEQSGLDADALASEVERLQMSQRQVFADLSEVLKRLHEAEQKRDALTQGHDAAGAASDKAEAASELLDVAGRWLQRAAAAKLAARAIERHRAAVQDPLLARASALFAIATDGGFRELGVDYDKDDAPTLVGLRENASRVPVAGMSEGARDQLFLSLRLALLELRKAEPLPFVGDDLLASFDDARTKRALELLAEFGRSRQAILFTHHRHVADIAMGLVGANIDVIEL